MLDGCALYSRYTVVWSTARLGAVDLQGEVKQKEVSNGTILICYTYKQSLLYTCTQQCSYLTKSGCWNQPYKHQQLRQSINSYESNRVDGTTSISFLTPGLLGTALCCALEDWSSASSWGSWVSGRAHVFTNPS